MTDALDVNARSLDVDRATSILRELLRDRELLALDVLDESLRRVRLETAVEHRVLDRVLARKPAEPIVSPRDITPLLWELPVEPSDPFVDEPQATFEDPATGQITDCPLCKAKGEVPCDKCGGTTRVDCDSCRGAGYVTDSRGSSKICRFCHGQKHQPCRQCKVGTLPCKACESTGRAYTIQRARVRWLTRKESRVVSASPPEVIVDDIAPVHERFVRNEHGALAPAQLESLDAPLRAAARALLSEHPLPEGARIKRQTLIVERVPVYTVRYRSRGKERSARFVGDPPRPLDVDPPLNPITTLLVSLALVALAAAALFATGALGHRAR